MFDGRKYYAPENAAIDAAYKNSIETMERLLREDASRLTGPYRDLLMEDGRFLLALCAFEEKIGIDYLFSRPLDELIAENRSWFRELEPEQYGNSMANPAYAAEIFGPDTGPLLSFFHVGNRQHIRYAPRHERFTMLETHDTWIRMFEYCTENKQDLRALTDILTARHRRDRTDTFVRELRERLDPGFHLLDGDESAFPSDDPRQLFYFGWRVTEHEIEAFHFINSLTQKDIDAIASSVARAYARGFIVENKNRTGRTECAVWACLGQERICRRLLHHLRNQGFNGAVKFFMTPPVNRQYGFDHQFDAALYLTPSLVEEWSQSLEKAMETCRDLYPAFSGTVYFETFGDPPFNPTLKKENIAFSPEQKKLISEWQRRNSDIHERFLSRKSTSFTAVAFPSTEIGSSYREIFREMAAVNTIDPDEYAAIQQTIINALDAAEHVRVRGRSPNRTDLTVRLRPLAHPDRETNFVNCGADINIPVGEVFTSPQLRGTHGVLHVHRAYLFRRLFENIELTFSDGMITDYRCSNHPTPEENRRYIEEHLLFPHKTLPLGEFAIGTNTRAFAMSRKFDVLDKLPVLIIEKMGPHFAVGDTCFAHQEDHPVFNSVSGKEITARENEKSALRKSDPQNAYTFTHIDITLPFDDIGSIIAVDATGGEKDIIRDGVFVLPGTEVLNGPLRTDRSSASVVRHYP